MPNLFDPIQLGAIHAPNRLFMAPLTRGRATRAHVPTPIMADYYAQRASAGLIISEATGISQQGLGWAYAPGLWNDEQTDAWKPVVEAVHAAGGRIVAQLWHMGRLVHPDFLGGEAPVSASANTAPGSVRTYPAEESGEIKRPYAQARPLRTDEIPGLLDDYARAARNAIRAGFDGVQVHAANGYLIDSFLRDNSNFREDQYGGSIPNRVRLLKEVTQRVVDTIGGDRTGVRLSPNGEVQGINDSNPAPLFEAAAATLDEIGIAFLEMREPRPGGTRGLPDHPPVHPGMRKVFKGPLILNADYHLDDAQAALDAGEADAIAYGRTFLANPDLPLRLRERLPLNPQREELFYIGGTEGYTDYPAWDAKAA
ncbi:alkene reductase [Sphingomonas sp. NIBR02145]|uniref:alkene reductase n=1 Tax=Sphingomonas sp. NIBR02145 TaxID=3014784 RepID=UPI0022B473AC|nr:alkene reductase [Sphingomonas sp. NIBR02145]WHU01630.1 alkene reductase [Sphingomonas sp. NIBR02145]